MDHKPGEFPSMNWQHAKHTGFMTIQLVPKYKGEAILSPKVWCRMPLPHTALLPNTDQAHSQSKEVQLCQHQGQNEHLALPVNTSGYYGQPKITYPTKASRNHYFCVVFFKESEEITLITWGHSWTCLWSLASPQGHLPSPVPLVLSISGTDTATLRSFWKVLEYLQTGSTI